MEVLFFPSDVDFSEEVDASYNDIEDPEEDLACQVLIALIKSELRAAKTTYVNDKNTEEILLPSGLLNSVACDILRAARDEPCGIRGCVLNINYLDESYSNQGKKCIGRVVCDPYTVNTFQLDLTLKSEISWTFKLPHFVRNLRNRSTMIISSDYTLTMKQLYCSF